MITKIKNEDNIDHIHMRQFTFFLIVISTTAVIFSVITLPMIYNFLQTFQRHLIIETNFCKTRSKNLFIELEVLQTKIQRQKSFFIYNFLKNPFRTNSICAKL